MHRFIPTYCNAFRWLESRKNCVKEWKFLELPMYTTENISSLGKHFTTFRSDEWRGGEGTGGKAGNEWRMEASNGGKFVHKRRPPCAVYLF